MHMCRHTAKEKRRTTNRRKKPSRLHNEACRDNLHLMFGGKESRNGVTFITDTCISSRNKFAIVNSYY